MDRSGLEGTLDLIPHLPQGQDAASPVHHGSEHFPPSPSRLVQISLAATPPVNKEIWVFSPVWFYPPNQVLDNRMKNYSFATSTVARITQMTKP